MTKSIHTCSQCGSELIFVREETIKPEGSRYPQTNSIYKCSNEECQKTKDKEKVDRLKLRQKREVAEQERNEKAEEKRSAAREAKLKQV